MDTCSSDSIRILKNKLLTLLKITVIHLLINQGPNFTHLVLLFVCNQYSALRNNIFNEIFRIENYKNILNNHVLLWGDCSLGITDNNYLFNLVYLYIKILIDLIMTKANHFCTHVCKLLYYVTLLILLMTFHLNRTCVTHDLPFSYVCVLLIHVFLCINYLYRERV